MPEGSKKEDVHTPSEKTSQDDNKQAASPKKSEKKNHEEKIKTETKPVKDLPEKRQAEDTEKTKKAFDVSFSAPSAIASLRNSTARFSTSLREGKSSLPSSIRESEVSLSENAYICIKTDGTFQ